MGIKSFLTLRFIPCHRRPERSLVIGGTPFLCYRCLAILIGYAFIPVFLMVPLHCLFAVGIALQLPMFVDGYTQYRKWRQSNQVLRVATGLLAGAGQAALVVSLAQLCTQFVLKM